METSAVTEASLVSILILRPTDAIALAKQAAYPAAKSCSGSVPLPLPPSAGGMAREIELTVRAHGTALAAVGGGGGGVQRVHG
ncbi:hypothetical protein SCALM49S_09599 [Streptomyces californicus]